MDNTVIVALLSCAGTLAGSIAGILTANKLAMYRIEQLERKVDKHNGLMEWRATAELRIDALEKKGE